MRTRSSLFLALLLIAPMAWAGTTSVESTMDVVARRLHARLSACLPDPLFEAERLNGGWVYRSMLDFDKTRVDELRVRLDPSGAVQTGVTVDVVRKICGLFFCSEETLAPEAAVWGERISHLAQERPTGVDCFDESRSAADQR